MQRTRPADTTPRGSLRDEPHSHRWLAAIVGGLALVAGLTFHLFDDLEQSYYLLAFAMGLCLTGAPAGLWLVGAITPRRRATAR